MHSPIGPLLQTVSLSICEVFLVAISGYVLARQGILDRRTQRQLNQLNIALFTPSLIFSKVAFTLSPEKLRELWIVPIFFVALSFVSAGVAWAMSALFGLRPTQRNFAIAAAMFMNSNSLPIALLQSLVVSVPGLNWGDDDTTGAKVGRALTYLALCSTIGMVFRWSIGVRLLTASDPSPSNEELYSTHHVDSPERTPLLVSELAPESTANGPEITVGSPRLRNGHHHHHDDRLYLTPDDSRLTLAAPTDLLAPAYPASESESDSDSDILRMQVHQPAKPGTFNRVWSAMKRAMHKFTSFMTPPLYASVISILIALWPYMQHALNAHITPVKQALVQLGNCSIPVTLVVLGAYFHQPAFDEAKSKVIDADLDTSAPRRRTWWQRSRSMFSLRTLSLRATDDDYKHKSRAIPGEGRTVFVSVVSRMLVVPALFLPFMALGAARNTPPVFEDPVFILSLVLLIGSPPAVTLSLMTQAVGGDAFERLISRTIFWSYCVVTPPSTVVLALVSMLMAKL